tara:strand:- start:34 stop:345 length:312 start_codon:yes stop_codon:yes gene_type:complete
MKTFREIAETKASIWNTKPKTLEDAQDPEVYIHGFGRLQFSQMKQRLVRASEDFLKWSKRGDVDYIENKLKAYQSMVEGIRDVEKEMSKPSWKKKITILKRKG